MENSTPTQQLTYPLDFTSTSVLNMVIGDYLKQTYDSFMRYPYASTITLKIQNGGTHETTTVNATGNCTISTDGPGYPGQHLYVVIINDGTSGKTITFGTNMSSNGTLSGTTSKTAAIQFVSNGEGWYEVSRQTGMTILT